MGGKVRLPPAMQIGRKVRLPLATPMEDIDFLKSMLHGALPLAARNDVILAHFLTMAYEHAIDLLSGKVPIQAKTPPQNGLTVYRSSEWTRITRPRSRGRARVGFGNVTGDEVDG
ncbi:hypothetical protein GB928_025730 [Shinella curvata]|uniref:Uncharacterized protein n=1 Tax=Shinella curvata TaxID=1817964 RepID=A0ABT8XLL6_9HYPH|nr:hypothetical protein [Shinella curvata]MCJ8056988.1 hypothetical protein [Shinella curvata]MDO6124592.1 hypothetical protein [Shinella curvata]